VPPPGRLWLSGAAVSRSPVFFRLSRVGSVRVRGFECMRCCLVLGRRSGPTSWGPGTVECVCLGASVGVHYPPQSGHPVGLLHHPQAPFSGVWRPLSPGSAMPVHRFHPAAAGPAHWSRSTSRVSASTQRPAAGAAVGTESEGDPNSGGRLPGMCTLWSPEAKVPGRCGARCVAPDRYYPTWRAVGTLDPGSDRAHRIGEATSSPEVTGGSSASESNLQPLAAR
jgi:hypothetical protein